MLGPSSHGVTEHTLLCYNSNLFSSVVEVS